MGEGTGERAFSADEYPAKDLTERIIAAAVEVHKILGPGFMERLYENSLAREFELRGISFERQVEVEVPYKDVLAGEHRLDFVVEGAAYVEAKAVSQMAPIHDAQVISCLKASGLRIGLLVNFHQPQLVDGLMRFVV